MYFQIETVLDQYGLKDAKISKGRGVLLCEKEQRLYALKEYDRSPKKADFLYQLGEFLQSRGIITDGLVENLNGEPVSEGVDGIRYTLHRWYRGRECDIRSRVDILGAVGWLARFHMVVREFSWEQKDAFLVQTPENEYERHNRELRKIYRFVAKRKQKSDYERLFLKSYPLFYQQCEELQALMQSKQEEGLSPWPGYGLCHGDFNYHNFLFSATRPVVVHFEKAEYDLQIFDFCNFKRKVMEKHGWDCQLGFDMLREYHRYCPMDEGTFWQMYMRLAYPEKFWKLANRYYVSNKTWISRQNCEKLEKEIAQNERRCRYLEELQKNNPIMFGKK